MEELQFTLGEGPCVDASGPRRPVLQPDLARTGPQRWPGFAVGRSRPGSGRSSPFRCRSARSGSGFWTSIATARVASPTPSRSKPCPLPRQRRRSCSISRRGGPGQHPSDPVPVIDNRAEVHQATGMISVQAEVRLAEAMLLLRARAFASDGRSSTFRATFLQRLCTSERSKWVKSSATAYRGGLSPREQGGTHNESRRLAQVFVELADTLVDEFDAVDFLQMLIERCVELLEVDAAGLMLADQRGDLQLMNSTWRRARLLELFELQANEGPCLDCFATGSRCRQHRPQRGPRPLAAVRPGGPRGRLPRRPRVPMRLRKQVIGAFNLFAERQDPLGDDELGSPRPWPTWPPSVCCRSET